MRGPVLQFLRMRVLQQATDERCDELEGGSKPFAGVFLQLGLLTSIYYGYPIEYGGYGGKLKRGNTCHWKNVNNYISLMHIQ